jgi:outer membrane protein insertion porin family
MHARPWTRLLVLIGLWVLAPARAQDVVGPRQTPTVVAITVEGEQRYSEAKLIEALGQRVGEPLDLVRIQRGLDLLFNAFRVRADVKQREVPGGLELRLIVTEMPVDLEPRFVGNAEIDDETLHRWAQIPERGELYLFQAERVRQRLLEGYRQEGFAEAEIDVVRRGEAGTGQETPDVIFEIREGPQIHVSDVVVRGNHHLPDRGWWFWKDGLQMLSKVELDGPGLFDWYGSKFDRDKLEADLLAMRNTYRDLGYLDAVVELDRLDYSADRSRVTIHVIVDEGRRWTISRMAIRAVDRKRDPKDPDAFVDTPVELIYPEKELLALCQLAPGKAYERVRQTRDQAALRKHYGKDGYLAHPSLGQTSWQFLEPDLHFDFEKHEVAVTYLIAQGEQRFIREVLFEGGLHTRDRVLRREVDVLPGSRADVEEINRSLSRLYSTAYFSDEMASLEHKDPTYSFKPVEGQPSWVDLYYQVEEGRVVNLQLSGGVDSNNGAFARILLDMRNFDVAALPSSLWRMPGEVYSKEAFHGAGQRLVFEISPGTEINSFQVHFIEPDLFRTHFDPTSLDVSYSGRRRGYRAYDEERIDRRVRFGQEFGREWTAWAGFSHQDITVSDIEAPLDEIVQPDELPLADSLFEQEGESLLVGALFDVQYRKLDRTLNPTDGFQAKWLNGFYGDPLGGDWNFVKSNLDFDWFWALGSEELDVRPGFHLALNLGVADDHSGTNDVPYTERFFLGGNRSLRGFDFRGVGPNKGGEPLGGETMLNASFEYRHPLYSVAQAGTYKQIEIFHLKLFTDAGILDPAPWNLDMDELRASVGFGFGLSHPLPISLNFGFPIRTGDGDREEVFSFSIVNITF